jgi:uncharacterized protein YlxW (UPF0749 family)
MTRIRHARPAGSPPPPPDRPAGPRLTGRLTVAAVAGILGVLVVGQLRGQAGVPGLSAMAATELTQLIANLTTGNDLLRDEIAELERQEASLAAARARGETTVDQLNADLARIRAWAGLTAVSGPGIAITVRGAIGGNGIDDLINELRNAGAEAIAVAGVRVVPGVVVAGVAGALSVENTALGDTFEIRAIGSPQILTGTLTRIGGVVAQIETAYVDVTLTVTPVDRLTVPATERTLLPTEARPRL